MSDLLPCQALFGMSRGAQINQAIEEETGQPCPCRQGRTCPLVPPVRPPKQAKLAELKTLPNPCHGGMERFATFRPIAQ